MTVSLIFLTLGLIFGKERPMIQSHLGDKGDIRIIDGPSIYSARLYKELENNLHESVLCWV